MSTASRQRELHLRMRRGFPTFELFREAQRAKLGAWVESADVKAARETWLAVTFAGRELVPMVYPDKQPGWDVDIVESPSLS